MDRQVNKPYDLMSKITAVQAWLQVVDIARRPQETAALTAAHEGLDSLIKQSISQDTNPAN